MGGALTFLRLWRSRSMFPSFIYAILTLHANDVLSIVCRHHVKPELDDNNQVRNQIDASVDTLHRLLDEEGKTVYGRSYI